MTPANSWATLVVITTWAHVNFPVPRHTGGTGDAVRLVAGELTLTLVVNPLVALHGSPATSNQLVVKPPPLEESQALLKTVEKPLFAAKSCATITALEFAASGALRLPESVISLAEASAAKSAAF